MPGGHEQRQIHKNFRPVRDRRMQEEANEKRLPQQVRHVPSELLGPRQDGHYLNLAIDSMIIGRSRQN